MKMLPVLTKRLSVLLVCDAIAFASAGAIVMVAFAESGLALAAAATIGISALVAISWWLGEALAGLLQRYPAARLGSGSQEERVEHATDPRVAPHDVDGLSF